ncbi:hypothetical protein Tco_0613701 [Tanacetum coccineum]
MAVAVVVAWRGWQRGDGRAAVVRMAAAVGGDDDEVKMVFGWLVLWWQRRLVMDGVVMTGWLWWWRRDGDESDVVRGVVEMVVAGASPKSGRKKGEAPENFWRGRSDFIFHCEDLSYFTRMSLAKSMDHVNRRLELMPPVQNQLTRSEKVNRISVISSVEMKQNSFGDFDVALGRVVIASLRMAFNA